MPEPRPPQQTGPAAKAAARLATARATLGGGADLPAPVWEDATRQLAGMLQALVILQTDVPALAPPGAAIPPATGPVPGVSGPPPVSSQTDRARGLDLRGLARRGSGGSRGRTRTGTRLAPVPCWLPGEGLRPAGAFLLGGVLLGVKGVLAPREDADTA